MGAPVIVEAIRTPVGKRAGMLSHIHPAYLLAGVQTALLARAQVEPREVGQVFGGCVTQAGEQAFNVTRTAWLCAGLPYEIAATTIDCQCGSSQQANHIVHSMIAADVIDVGIACGVESMSRVGIGVNISNGPGRPRPADFPYDMPNQFIAAERIAKVHGLGREDVDAFALSSQDRARRALEERRLERQIVSVSPQPSDSEPGQVLPLTRDEGIRPSTAAGLAALRPTLPDGIHTAGNTSQISDGAAAILWMSRARAESLGLTARARIVAQVLVGSDPYFHIDGPINATRALIAKSGMSIRSIDLFEINEAFASVVLAWQRTFDVDGERLNVNGGAIALGHPLGATGARLITAALHELERTDREFALIAMCCGGAIATGTILQRL